MHTRLVLLLLLYHRSHAWVRPKLEYCDLHPDLELRIQHDVGFWGEGGITEDVALSVCKFCNSAPPRRHQQEQQGQKHDAERDPELRLLKEKQLLQEQRRSRGRSRQLQAEALAGADCNKPQRVLIQNGTVFLTNLLAAENLGPFEHIGFLVELYEASQVYRLPDVEFTYWFGDNAPAHTVINPDGTTAWPYSPSGGTPAVISWSKWNENAALVVPYSGAYRCPTDSWDALEFQLEILAAVPWEQRKEVAFGRWNAFCTHYISWMKTADGEVMKCPRIHISKLSEEHPELLDAYDLGRAKPVPLLHQNRYKYIVSTDGWSISSKFDKYLLLGSTVFKAASTRYGFYYDAIKPYQHYVPFMVNSSDDIIETLTWAKTHDEEVRRIAEEGQRFALHNLNRRARLCYLFRLMTELSKKLRYKPRCERRGLCVPLVREIRFLQAYHRTTQSCRYQEVLLRYGMYDAADADPYPGAQAGRAAYGSGDRQLSSNIVTSLDELQRLHESSNAWPRDDLLLPLQP